MAHLRRSFPLVFHTASTLSGSLRSPPSPRGEGGPRQRRSGALVNGALETIFPALFHTASTLSGSLRSPPSPRGEGFVSRKAVSSYHSLPHWGRGTAQRRSGALVNDALETIFPALFHTASTLSGSLRSPPSPRGEGFVLGIPLPPSNLRPFGAPPSIGRREHPREPLPLEGAAERSEAGLASFLRRSRRLFAFSIGKGVVSRKPVFSFRRLPHWGRGTAQRWIGCSRISST